jgi:hypothetical protein
MPRLRSSNYLALVLAAVGIGLIIFGLVTPSGHTGGMGSGSTNYSLNSLLLCVVGAFIAATALSYIYLKEEYVPYAPRPIVEDESAKIRVGGSEHLAESPPSQKEAGVEPIDTEEGELILRLLTGDERVMFKAILDSGGVALQKDLIVKTKMSDAKVSRTIDRLVEKDLIVKERYGVTNRVSIVIDK